MKNITEKKKIHMENLSTANGIIGALAIDQRGALKKMFLNEQYLGDVDKAIVTFKELVSTYLTPYASSILLDPEYGIPAAKKRHSDVGLLLAYEKTGYDTTIEGRFPDLIDDYSAYRIKQQGADGVKFLLYYDVDSSTDINDKKHAFVERIGAECMALDIPFYLELVSYDERISDTTSAEYAKIKPHKVNQMMKEFSKEQYHVDVLKVEVPINMAYVEGYQEDNEVVIYTQNEAKEYFKEQSNATELPFIFLSAGVSASLFQETLKFAKKSGSTFNGVLCGRATWKDAVPIFIKEGESAAKEWMQTQGRKNIEELNYVLSNTATSWKEKIS